MLLFCLHVLSLRVLSAKRKKEVPFFPTDILHQPSIQPLQVSVPHLYNGNSPASHHGVVGNKWHQTEC